MKLIDLHPKWVSEYGGGPDIIGVTFDCPCCGGKTRLGVLFKEPIDRDGLPSDVHWTVPDKLWNRTGETFDTLTLTPSVDCSKWGHWHGHITNGEAA